MQHDEVLTTRGRKFAERATLKATSPEVGTRTLFEPVLLVTLGNPTADPTDLLEVCDRIPFTGQHFQWDDVRAIYAVGYRLYRLTLGNGSYSPPTGDDLVSGEREADGRSVRAQTSCRRQPSSGAILSMAMRKSPLVARQKSPPCVRRVDPELRAQAMTVKVPTDHYHRLGVPLKSAKDRMDIISAYRELRSYRAAAEVCGTTHKTVKPNTISPSCCRLEEL